MKISQAGIDLICKFESFEANPYPDPGTGGIPFTIGYGTTVYPDGRKVTMEDAAITEEQAVQYLLSHVEGKCYPALVGIPINQNQFDALCSFIYNLGAKNFKISTLRKKVLANPNDPTIKSEFDKWVKAAGKTLNGLVRRRVAESDLYFS